MKMKRIAAGAIASVAVTGMLVGTSTPAHAMAYPTYFSGFLNPTKVLDVANYSLADRGKVHLFALRSTGDVRNQRWTARQVGTLNGNITYEIKNQLSGKCLDKSESQPNANGNAVYQYGCTGANNQKWEKIPYGSSGWTQLKNVAGGRCLDIQNQSWVDGATIHVWDCYSQSGAPAWSQRWNILP
ncbi:RICIN domain-containing protein [Streptosporangium subroseum]|uniref:RICIN domain-containing protein n=1 Tax=Streptosporangium subroseum TaxID=106412 RepID=UPI003091E31D|nr:RICIN domain-containing protein [Streptosporangium subroseum]